MIHLLKKYILLVLIIGFPCSLLHAQVALDNDSLETKEFMFSVDRLLSGSKEIFWVNSDYDSFISIPDEVSHVRLFASEHRITQVFSSALANSGLNTMNLSLGAYREERLVENVETHMSNEGELMLSWDLYPEAEGYVIFRDVSSVDTAPEVNKSFLPVANNPYKIVKGGDRTILVDQLETSSKNQLYTYYVMAYGLSSGNIFLTKPTVKSQAINNGNRRHDLKVTVYPTIVRDKQLLLVDVSSLPVANLDIWIKDTNGKTVFEDSFISNTSPSQTLALDYLRPGVYIITFQQGSYTQVERFIIGD